MGAVKVLGRLIAIRIVLGAEATHGRTWYVERDGSGDFWNIQNAVDIAEDGDVIEIGPGLFRQ